MGKASDVRPTGTSYSNGATIRGSDDYDALRLIVHRRVEHINAHECSIDGQERSELVIVDPANKSINIGKESSKRT